MRAMKKPLFPFVNNTLPLILFVILSLTGCERPDPEVTVVASPGAFEMPPTPLVTRSSSDTLPPTPVLQPSDNQTPLVYQGTPTPDPPHPTGESSEPFISHTVSAGETLGYLAQLYGSSVEELQTVNQLGGSDLLYVGQVLQIPTQGQAAGPSFKIIPDSELVYGPAAKDFDVRGFAARVNGYLVTYGEDVAGQWLDGPAIVQLVADRYSVNPRLLLAVLEYRAGWVTQTAVTDDGYPLGYRQPNSTGNTVRRNWAGGKTTEPGCLLTRPSTMARPACKTCSAPTTGQLTPAGSRTWGQMACLPPLAVCLATRLLTPLIPCGRRARLSRRCSFPGPAVRRGGLPADRTAVGIPVRPGRRWILPRMGRWKGVWRRMPG
ncbi:MAG: LysM peptidoglycan-binding domain-containing protein [Anaerolineae bacterium]